VTGPARLQALLDEGVAAGVFPCASAVVLQSGRRVFEGAAGGATARTVFDLASLTKVVATTVSFLTLWRDGLLEVGTPVARVLPTSAAGRAGVTVADLLAHRAGLPAFLPLFAPIVRATPELLEPDCPAGVRAAARAEAMARALAVAPTVPPRTRYEYSDIGFVVLGELVAQVAGHPLDAVAVGRVTRPLGLDARFHRLSACRASTAAIGAPADLSGGLVVAPTGRSRPREPAPGQEGLWEPFAPHPSPAGEVDDDNAWVMDGVAGHAGLFGTASDVAAFGQAVLDDRGGAGRLAPTEHWAAVLQRDTVTPGSTCGLGFHTRVPGDPVGDSSAGRLVGMVPPGAVGHVGFTGTSLWIDLARQLVVALCTNRVAGPRGRADVRIREFRPRFHDTAVDVSVGASSDARRQNRPDLSDGGSADRSRRGTREEPDDDAIGASR
jgi:CubicO group peptidase (beta-lactamase class C family)